ncbi:MULTISPECIES: cytochrome b/b6 domain-containing protein [Haloprofundus]|uniref:cytochrome b/b6 domain-containing protein n=1 Tax=Haloprofundus TaxID=1911573 RepID=UPI000E43E528|nr:MULTISPECIES: cytochrome b/b6 domain-containing protein [Haloprofundus]QCJ46033.1 cytochrome b/b6 domain-containing protein [Haloprofundus sp. MHR1]
MTNLDHGKFTRMTTTFHTLLALDVFILFFSGYGLMFNDELWWLVTLMGGSTGVTAVHRIAGLALVALIVFWVLMMLTTSTGRGNFREILMGPDDVAAAIQDFKFVLGMADERHPNARQFAGYKSDDVPLLSYIGKGVIYIFSIELTLLTISGLLIWSKTGVMQYFATKTAAMAFVVFHGLLGVIMLMGVMFHIFEHGFHPAFYPVEVKAFIPRKLIPEEHADTDHDSTGISQLTLAPSWGWATNVMGVLTVIGIVSVLVGSIFDEGYPVPRELVVGGGPTDLLLTVGINVGILVLFIGMALQMYGNLLRVRWQKQLEQEARATATTDGGQVNQPNDD